MVQQAMQYIDLTPDIDTRVELITTLNLISAGKVTVAVWLVWFQMSFENWFGSNPFSMVL